MFRTEGQPGQATVRVRDETGTALFGEALGKALAPGDIIGLTGDLGTGKTTLTRSIARGCDVPEGTPVNSPTFTIMNLYEGSELRVCHLDFYRLEGADELGGLGLEDLLDERTVFVVEWYEQFPEALPDDVLTIQIERVDENQRRFMCQAHGPHSRELLESLEM